ncbi:sulfite exporter TauE/SafE family protein [Marinovum sp. 2_MG-2023]|uniref:sulfite exporter TauE/SafE family protein n=1 Tax=unclassified Marinovum TaxID=2647166 RepID=UPI0026E2987A|nr:MULTISPECIES: sulfite exporter TauE/SafE family protein [unclassified Marinovum]MDO6731889.1 sulfite exporter TauE/SafE family protein [Marinovum sp. 2_MG-2023]MDO6781141.1 sulfite exporter TauE/SafE family protein [Marinovum sp. 1_MG-2023]
MFDLTVIAVAAFFAGVLNAVAGGGSFLTFPALVFVGVPPIAANATSTVAVFPGYLSGALGFLPEIKTIDRRELAYFLGLSIVGGIAGALLLLVTPSEIFSFVVPWLLLFATVLFAFDQKIRSWMRPERGRSTIGKTAATLAVTTYGGYFNGGLGIVLLALFSGLGFRDINLMNGLKNALSFILSAASVVTFLLAGIVFLKHAVIMMLAATIGGYVGARIARKMSVALIRKIVIVIGLGMTVAFWLQG